MLVVVLAGLSVGVVPAGNERPMRGFMREKLNFAGGVLEGITLENYPMAITNAVLLRNMNLTNSFSMLGHVDYRRNITNFQARVDQVISAARVQDLEKVTEAYTMMARSCVQCHKDFRRVQFIQHQLERRR